MGVVASQLPQPPGVGTGQWGEPVTMSMTWFVPFAFTWVLLLHSHITSHLVSSVGTGQWGEPVIMTWFVLIITCFNVITWFLVILLLHSYIEGGEI